MLLARGAHVESGVTHFSKFSSFCGEPTSAGPTSALADVAVTSLAGAVLSAFLARSGKAHPPAPNASSSPTGTRDAYFGLQT